MVTGTWCPLAVASQGRSLSQTVQRVWAGGSPAAAVPTFLAQRQLKAVPETPFRQIGQLLVLLSLVLHQGFSFNWSWTEDRHIGKC